MASCAKVTKAKRAIRDNRHSEQRGKKVRVMLSKLERENGLLIAPSSK